MPDAPHSGAGAMSRLVATVVATLAATATITVAPATAETIGSRSVDLSADSCVFRDSGGHQVLVLCEFPCATLDWPDDHESLLCVGADHAVYEDDQLTPGGPWTGWRSLGGYATSGITIYGNRTWRPQIVVSGRDPVIRYERHWTGLAWSQWAVLNS
jgi:hypothetical protein